MTFLPSSVRHLKAKQGEVDIALQRNRNLQRLPYDIGQLQNVVKLSAEHCEFHPSLPWTIGRLPPTCEVTDYDGNKQTVKDMEPQFKVPWQRFITGLINFSSHKRAELIERLYHPGAAGHENEQERHSKQK
eukprot:CAMPEP_0197240956 /NCGR_PEP_ID=MMETSP1429-20130617/7128_1 /TAXON_ID=49237 /ORGANISM="Chaetoceros  sp., Strain UNC1202" /LENGTH=130 /DNA_ID=CAMNT_0042700709 /DNA_START=13 /DNA_END=405 /DNA_ORIENTATION=-